MRFKSTDFTQATEQQKEQNHFDHPFLDSINPNGLSQVCKKQTISNKRGTVTVAVVITAIVVVVIVPMFYWEQVV